MAEKRSREALADELMRMSYELKDGGETKGESGSYDGTSVGTTPSDENIKFSAPFTAAMAFMASGNFGPERNAPLNTAWAKRFTVPAGKRAIARFSFEAWFENAIMVYSVDDDYYLRAERGNYRRSREDWVTDVAEQDKSYIITGWHKNGPPSHRRDWFQSPMRVFVQNSTSLIVGFEDAGQDDYDDGLCTITIRD